MRICLVLIALLHFSLLPGQSAFSELVAKKSKYIEAAVIT